MTSDSSEKPRVLKPQDGGQPLPVCGPVETGASPQLGVGEQPERLE